MSESDYKSVIKWFNDRPKFLKRLRYTQGILTLAFIISYGILIISLMYLIIKSNDVLKYNYIFILVKIIISPVVTLIAVTVFRNLFSQKRPYEVYNFTPLFKNQKPNKSFPSQHVASAIVIAMAFLYVNTYLGIIFLLMAFAIAFIRVLSGMHFIKDVIAAVFLGAITGYFIFLNHNIFKA